MSDFQNIVYSKTDGIATIALNRPEAMNSFVPELTKELVSALADVREDEAVRVAVLTGAGKAFCAGGDLSMLSKGMSAAESREVVLRHSRMLVTEITNLEKPVVAMVNGFAVGAGCSLALACDLIIAADNARFGQVFVNVGLMPDMGSIFLLPRVVGLHRAKELIFLGDVIDAREAERIGLVNRVVPAAELEETTMGIARRLAKGPTRAIGLAKVLLHRALATDLGGALELDALGQAICFQSEDFKEGASAFFAKRPAEFKGR